MPLDWQKAFVRHEAGELKSLLALLQSSVTAEAERVVEETEEFENTPIGPEDEDWVSFRQGELDDMFFTLLNYERWVYGGFMVTVLCWLCDAAIRHTHANKHAEWIVFMQRLGEDVAIEKEPFLWQVLGESLEPSDLVERLTTWIEVRNRFEHSYGFVASAEAREKFSRVLGIEFHPDMRMRLTADQCASLLEDAEAAALAIIDCSRRQA